MGDGSLIQRLRAAGLRPTVARIGILQVIQAAGMAGVAVDAVCRQMLLRGTRASTSTVYRVIRQLESIGLLQQDRRDLRETRYRLRPSAPESVAMRVACRRCPRFAMLDAESLHAELERCAADQGLRPVMADMVLQVECLGSRLCLPVPGAA